MSEVKNIEFTQIAADWNSITLGEENPRALLAIRNGLTTKQDQGSGDYKVSRIETIGGGWIDETRVRFVSDLKEKDVEKYRIQKGDILFSHINSDSHLGKTGFAERDYQDLLHGMNLLLIRANPEVFEAEFLNRVFQYYRDIGVFISICSRSVNQSSINQAKLKAVEVPHPPLREQKKIAHILSTVQRAIEAQERIIQTTTELKKALMHKLFTEGLRNEAQKQTEIGPVPESWEVVRVSTTGVVVTGSTPSTKNAEYYGGDYNLISPADLDNGKYVRSAHKTLTKAGFEKCRSVPRNSVLVGCIGNVGKLGMVADDCSTTNQQINSIIPNSDFSPHFLYYALQFCRPRLEQAAAKVTLPILNKSNFESFQIAAPELKEQEAIAGYLGILDQKLENAGQKAAQLQDIFRTLLHELMTAKTRVHELTFPATVGKS